VQGILKRIRRAATAGALSLMAVFNTAGAQDHDTQPSTRSPLFIQGAEALRKSAVYENAWIFSAAQDIIENSYYAPERVALAKDRFNSLRQSVRDGKMSAQVAINQILKDLDPHSYLDVRPLFHYRQRNDAQGSEAAGFDYRLDARGLRVTRVFYGSAAVDAGLLEGDVITKIDGEAPGAKTKDDLEGDICLIKRYDPKTRVKITVRRFIDGPLADKKLDCSPRKHSVQTRVLDGVGYIYLKEFSDGVSDDLRGAIDEMESRFGKRLKTYVLDLRGNPGGYLDEARQVIDLFVDSNKELFHTIDRNKNIIAFHAQPGDVLHGKRLAVLVDGDSFSASELTAESLQYNKRAVVIGTRTGGKGSVQSARPILPFHLDVPPQLKGMLYLTTELYAMKDGSSPQIKGVIPDITVLDDAMPSAEARSERQRPHALANPSNDGAALTKAEAARTQVCAVNAAFTQGYDHLKYATGAPDGALICALAHLQPSDASVARHNAAPSYAVAVPVRPNP
jgi:C-terminal peptidase prc